MTVRLKLNHDKDLILLISTKSMMCDISQYLVFVLDNIPITSKEKKIVICKTFIKFLNICFGV